MYGFCIRNFEQHSLSLWELNGENIFCKKSLLEGECFDYIATENMAMVQPPNPFAPLGSNGPAWFCGQLIRGPKSEFARSRTFSFQLRNAAGISKRKLTIGLTKLF